MAGGVRGGSAAAPRTAHALRVYQDLQAGAGRRNLPVLRHHGGLPAVVRGEPSGLARLWPSLIIARQRRSATPSPATAAATCSSASPEQSCSATPTRHRM